MDRSVVSERPAAAADRDGASFETFVAARGDALWRSAWLLTGDHQLAEDLVQTALAKSWRHWRRVGVDGFEAYVRRVMFTTYAAWWRRKWRGERPTDELPEQSAAAPDSVGRTDLVSALAALPRAQRAVVVLRYFEDRTERETAHLLGISVGTVKSHKARALAALRSSPHLAGEENADE